MLPVIFIAALILLESRDIFNGFLSQPFAVSLLLILFWHFDPLSVLSLALATHLIYINDTPSGASLYPEYPFAFFIVISTFGAHQLSFSGLVLALILIIILSKTTAYALNKKRHLFEKYREYLVFYHKYPGLVPSMFFSLLFLSVYSALIYIILNLLISAAEMTGIANYGSDFLLHGHFLLLCLIFACRFALKNIRFKNA
jgi:hypothetical protein